VPYPPDMKAFLYFYIWPEKPRIAGELRLRVTSSDDAASFESGSDLLGIHGQPWSRPLCILPKYNPPLYEKLREEGFIPEDLDRALSTFPSNTLPSNKLRYSPTRQCLYTLNDTFIVDFSNHEHLYVITEKSIERLPIKKIFLDCRSGERCNKAPYTGAHTSLYRYLSLILY
jgi:hypothetical protein